MFSRVPRELLERWAAMRSEAVPRDGVGRILSLTSWLLGLWTLREAVALYREVMAELVWPLVHLLRAISGL